MWRSQRSIVLEAVGAAATRSGEDNWNGNDATSPGQKDETNEKQNQPAHCQHQEQSMEWHLIDGHGEAGSEDEAK
jgi:hypothetical protein